MDLAQSFMTGAQSKSAKVTMRNGAIREGIKDDLEAFFTIDMEAYSSAKTLAVRFTK